MKNYEFIRERDIVAMLPVGEITSRSYPELEKKLSRNLPGVKMVIFNMAKTDFIDSQGIVFLLRMREIVDLNGCYFAVFNPKHNVEKLFRRLQLEKILNVADNAEKCFTRILELRITTLLSGSVAVKSVERSPARIPVCVDEDSRRGDMAHEQSA